MDAIVDFMLDMKPQANERDPVGSIAIRFCKEYEVINGPGTAATIMGRAVPSGAHAFATLKACSAQALAMVADMNGSSTI